MCTYGMSMCIYSLFVYAECIVISPLMSLSLRTGLLKLTILRHGKDVRSMEIA